MKEGRENFIYFFIIFLCIVGIGYTTFLILKTPRQIEEFTELFLKYQKCNEGTECFNKIEMEKKQVLIDLNGDGVFDSNETYQKGDTFIFSGQYWNIVDVSETQVLFGKYPKEIKAGEVKFTFVIINHLGKAHEYSYVIKHDENIVYEEKMFVNNEESKEIDVSFFIREIGEAKISITLDTGEEIHFWLKIF